MCLDGRAPHFPRRMQTTYRPLSKRQRDEVRGYVALGPNVFRAALFLIAVGIVGWILRTVHLTFLRAALASDAVWIVPTIAFAIWLFRHGSRWTGGRVFRGAVRRDLARGEVAVHRMTATDAVELEESEDEGPTYFLLTADGSVMLFAGQYLEPYKRKGFPWTSFDLVETPESRVFLRIEAAGEKLPPSVRHPVTAARELKRFAAQGRYAVVDIDFAAAKEGRLVRLAAETPSGGGAHG